MSQHKPVPPDMDCIEFQEHLPELFAGPGGSGLPRDDESLQRHLKTCANCAALVRDLEYIAEQARQLLVPTQDPSDKVWANIQSKLKDNPGNNGNAD